jgi:hypothetical protein
VVKRGDAVQLGGRWTSDEVSLSGQVFEFRLWALLTEQSRGYLHIFLPLADRGIDALVHRRTDDAYLPVQAKSRTTLTDGEVHISVWADSLQDDKALLVGGLLTEGGLGPTFLVMPEGEFKQLAYLTSDNSKPLYSVEFGMRPRSYSKWLPWLVPTDRLFERFGIPPSASQVAVPHPPEWRSDVGFLGESETTRLLATAGDLNLFRPFPDNETAELAVLHLGTRRVVGLQIKTVEVTTARRRAAVHIYAPSFRPSPTTYFVVLAWHRDEGRFRDECLLIPSEAISGLCGPPDSHGHLNFEWHPDSAAARELAAYRCEIADLATLAGHLVSR